jgi:hypothetical protein
VFGIAVELALVVHVHIEVTFEEGGGSWRICYIGFTGSFARPGVSVIVVFPVEVMYYRILSVDQFVDVGHEVANGVCVGLMDLLEQLDVGDSLFIVSDDVFVFDTRKGVAVLEVAVGLLTESFTMSHSYSCEVVSITRMIVGHLVIGREEARQGRLGGDALYWEVIEPQEWCLAHHEGEVSRHVVFIAAGGTRCDAVHLEPYTRVGAPVVLLNSWLEVFWVSDRPETS